MIEKLIKAGMNCARLNCSHGTPSDRQPVVAKLKKVRNKLGAPVAILIDTKGPEFRIKTFKDGFAEVKDGDSFTFTTNDVEGDNTQVSLNCGEICSSFEPGDIILANDGLVKFEVVEANDKNIDCKVLIGGKISNNKSLNFPGKVVHQKYLSKTDELDLRFAIKNGLDYVACSFVSNKEDIKSVREFLNANGGSQISLIAKIENQSGIDNVEEISEYCDGIMVARGDLGVEIDYDVLPFIQKQIIHKCIKLGKLGITSTEMLESMITNPRPSRAETSDVANAVYDGSACLMLSGETAMGKYPVESVEAMSNIAIATERNVPYTDFIKRRTLVCPGRTVDAIAHATCTIAVDVKAKGIVNLTASGFTSEIISNFRPHVNVCSITLADHEFYKLSLY
ncbi:MAG: pyruvate kinase [Clostridia bacterium]|nr:pyruvate kinase [Clostridia bacterium]